MGRKPKYKLEDILVVNSKIKSSQSLKKRLLKEELLLYECAICGMGPEWHNKTLTLQLDHANGIADDNRLENLRILCPNCHTQTNTYGGKNRKTARLIKYECPICLLIFERLESIRKRRKGATQYCNNQCANKANGLKGLNSRYGKKRLPERIELTCIRCKKTFTRKTNFERFKQKHRKDGPFCSSSCVSKWNSKLEKTQRKEN